MPTPLKHPKHLLTLTIFLPVKRTTLTANSFYFFVHTLFVHALNEGPHILLEQAQFSNKHILDALRQSTTYPFPFVS